MKIKPIYNDDSELRALAGCWALLRPLGWDTQWRVLNYLLVRVLGRSWMLPKPESDTK